MVTRLPLAFVCADGGAEHVGRLVHTAHLSGLRRLQPTHARTHTVARNHQH